eukprot:gene35789-43408_t
MNTTDSEEASDPTAADYCHPDKVIKAVQYGDLKFVETAVEIHHVSVDLKDKDDCGENKEIPLQWAVRQAHCAPA